MEYSRHRERTSEPQNPEYRAQKTKEVLEFAISGSGYLNRIKEEETKPRGDERYARSLLRNELCNAFMFASGKAGLVLCTETLSDPEIALAWQAFFTGENITYQQPLAPEYIHEVITQNYGLLARVPDHLIEKMFELHVARMDELQRQFEENELPQLMSEVNTKITQAINDGIIPISLSKWEHTRENTLIFLRDTLRDTDDTSGNANGATISISTKPSFEEKRHIAIHEFIHQLEGKLFVQTTDTPVKGYKRKHQKIKQETESVRGGLLYKGVFYAEPRRQWLNEAVTEDLAMVVNGQKTTEAYGDELALFEQLVAALGPGSRELIRLAYFEPSNPEQDPAERLEHYKKFTQLVTQTLGPNFLNRLEKFINKQQALIALEKWKQEQRNFPAFLEEWSEQERRLTQSALHLIETVRSKNSLVLARLTKYSSHKDYEAVWEEYFVPEISLPLQFAIETLRGTVIAKLMYNTKRETYRQKFRVGGLNGSMSGTVGKNASPAQPGSPS